MNDRYGEGALRTPVCDLPGCDGLALVGGARARGILRAGSAKSEEEIS